MQVYCLNIHMELGNVYGLNTALKWRQWQGSSLNDNTNKGRQTTYRLEVKERNMTSSYREANKKAEASSSSTEMTLCILYIYGVRACLHIYIIVYHVLYHAL